MRMLCRNVAVTMALLSGFAASAPAQAGVFAMDCSNGKSKYVISYDTETQVLLRKNPTNEMTYKIERVQIDGHDALVWGVTREHGGDMLAFFGKDKMVKYFYGNGSETTDACTMK